MADLDPPRDDAGDEGAMLDDEIENLIQPEHPAVLPFDAAKLHKSIVLAGTANT